MNDLLTKVIAFQSTHGRLYDLNFREPSSPEPTLLMPLPDKDSYQKVAQHYSGSEICWYDTSKAWTEDTVTVVWIDANGQPNLPLAKSFREFLSLLPFGTGIMYDVLYLVNKYRDDPQLEQLLNEDYPASVWSQQLAANETTYTNHSAFVKFLSQNNIEVAKDPLNVIKTANQP